MKIISLFCNCFQELKLYQLLPQKLVILPYLKHQNCVGVWISTNFSATCCIWLPFNNNKNYTHTHITWAELERKTMSVDENGALCHDNIPFNFTNTHYKYIIVFAKYTKWYLIIANMLAKLIRPFFSLLFVHS